ncbi:MAG: SH3 domain-containing protein, partial [Oscillospiraceae bacterium]
MRLTAKLFRIGLVAAALCSMCVLSAFAVYGGGTVNADALRLRTFADVNSDILATAPKDAAVVVLEDAVDGWFKVDYKTLVGYMSSDFLNATKVMDAPLGWGVVDTDGVSLNLRAGVGTTAALLDSIPAYTALEITGVNDGWYKVTYEKQSGYVSADYIRLSKDETGARNDGKGLEARSKKAAEEAASALGAKAVAIAKQQIGKPYVSGAKGPNAFDCSGFVYYVY